LFLLDATTRLLIARVNRVIRNFRKIALFALHHVSSGR
jgi:hypothetical protein